MSGSKLIKKVAERSLIPLNSLLLFFLLFEPRIVLPGWLQVFGRMHPLALHFPIVLFLSMPLLRCSFLRGYEMNPGIVMRSMHCCWQPRLQHL